MIRAPRAALALVAAAYVLPLVVPVPLMEDDEGLHAAIAIEMVERGDWTVPRLLGEPFRDKPILYFWMQAGSVALFGASEFSIRLPGTLTALAGVVAVGWLGRVLFGAAVGTWAALTYATMLLPYAVSLAPLHDLVMVPLVVLAFGAFWRLSRASTGGGQLVWTVVAGVALGLSILGKGLTGVGLVGVGMIAWMLWTRTWSFDLVGSAVIALMLAGAIAWPWYAAMERAAPGYLDYFFVQRHVEGVTGDAQRHAGRPVWYYLPILAAGTWPWIVELLRRPSPGAAAAGAAERLLWAWLVADVVFLSAAGSKLATYLLPALPAVAILAAFRVAHAPASPAIERTRLVAAAITGLLPVVAAVVLERVQGTPPAPWYGYVAALGPLALLGWASEGTRAATWLPAARLLAVTAAALVVVALTIRPLVAGQLTARGLSAHFNREGAMPPRVYIVDEGVGSFLFYLRPELRRGLTAERVQRVSRFSLGDTPDPGGAVVAVAADRLDGVIDLYDLPAQAASSGGRVGSFLVIPRADVRPKSR